MSDYNRTASFNIGLARELSIEAALIFDELSFWADKGKRPDGFIYKTLTELGERLPVKERTIRRGLDSLVEAGYIEKKVMRADSLPTMHFKILKDLRFGQIGQNEMAKMDNSIEMAKMDNSLTATKPATKNKQKPPASLGGSHSPASPGGYDSAGSERFGKPVPLDGGSPIPAAPLMRAEPYLLLTVLIRIVNPREKPTEDRLRNLRARRKDYTDTEILAAAHALSKSQWHRDNGQMSIDNLIRASKFGRWYQAAADTPSTPEDRKAAAIEHNRKVLAELDER